MLLPLLLCLLCFVQPSRTAAASTNAVASAKTAAGKWVSTKAGVRYRYTNGTYAKGVWLKVGANIYRISVKGYRITGWFTYRGYYYYADSKGRLYVKRLLTYRGSKYYLQSTGTCARNKWVKINGQYYYFANSRKMLTSRLIRLDNKYYYVNGSGVMLRSTWVKLNNKRYYFGADGVRVQKKWIRLNGKYYYLFANGTLAVNRWLGSYYVGADGARKTNCVVDGYYLDATGKRTKRQFTGQYIFVGDSRMVGMQSAKAPADTAYIAKIGEGYDWLVSTAGPELKTYLDAKPDVKVVFAFGINDFGNINSYITYYRKLISQYPRTKFYFMSVNPVDEEKEALHGFSIKNASIKTFNKKLYQALGTASYINGYSYLLKRGFDTIDGLHYTAPVYADLYQFILSKIK